MNYGYITNIVKDIRYKLKYFSVIILMLANSLYIIVRNGAIIFGNFRISLFGNCYYFSLTKMAS